MSDFSIESWFFQSVVLPKFYELSGSEAGWEQVVADFNKEIESGLLPKHFEEPGRGRARNTARKIVRQFRQFKPGQTVLPPSTTPVPPVSQVAITTPPKAQQPSMAVDDDFAELLAALDKEPQPLPKSSTEKLLEAVADKLESPYNKDGLLRLYWVEVPGKVNGRHAIALMTARYQFAGKEHNINGKVNGSVFRKCEADRVLHENGQKVEVAKSFRVMINGQEASGQMWICAVYVDADPVYLWHNNGTDTRKIKFYLSGDKVVFKEEKV